MSKDLKNIILRFRPFKWFFYRDWYSKRWGIKGVVDNETLYMIDIGAVTIGWRSYKL